MSRRRVTSHDVALRAGVSQSAVSRAFRPGASLSQALRERVVRAASDLGYTPNAFARGLLHRRTGLIGLVLEDPGHPIQALLLNLVLAGLEEAGLVPLVVRARDAATLAAGLARLEAYRPDSVLVCGPTLPPALGTRLREDGVPVVLLNRYPASSDGPAVARTDNHGGGAAMARHLIGLGHRRFGIVEGPPGAPAAADRVAGFTMALAEAGIAPPPTAPGDYVCDGGKWAASRLLSAQNRPTALFCCNDLMAIGALSAARELGLRVPEDVAVAGFDGIPLGAWSSPGLTTMAQDLGALAVAAFELLLARIGDPTLPGETRVVAAALVQRGSTAN